LHGSETWPVRKENEVALQRAEMRMLRWMCGVKLQDILLALGVSLCPSQMYEVTHVFIVVHIKTFLKSLGVKPKSLYIFLHTPTKLGLDPHEVNLKNLTSLTVLAIPIQF